MNDLRRTVYGLEDNIILKMERIDETELALQIVKKEHELKQENSTQKDMLQTRHESKTKEKIMEENWLLNKLRQSERQKTLLEMFIKEKNLAEEYEEFKSNLED